MWNLTVLSALLLLSAPLQVLHAGIKHYGFTTQPPETVLADTVYTYRVRTTTGGCALKQAIWRLEQAPTGVSLETDTGAVTAEAELRISQAEVSKRSLRLHWNLGNVAPGSHDFTLSWQAQTQCPFHSAQWGPIVQQQWTVNVHPNDWYDGDLHVHTQHSERGPEAGGIYDYYRRMVNLAADDNGDTFADRRRYSPRGRLHWLVTSDHTDRTYQECGAHFYAWCGGDVHSATGLDVAKYWTEKAPSTLIVMGAEISNLFLGHFGFIPLNPYPNHPLYAPNYAEKPTHYLQDNGYGAGVFRERWVDTNTTNSEEMAQIHELNALAIVNHEAGPAPWVTFDWTTRNFDGIEIWNGGLLHDRFDDHAYHALLKLNPVIFQQQIKASLAAPPRAFSWIDLLKAGHWPMAAVGGSDTHDFNEVTCDRQLKCKMTRVGFATPMTSIRATHFVWADGHNGVVDGLRQGRTVVHDGANFLVMHAEYEGKRYQIGDSIPYRVGSPITLRAFGRAAKNALNNSRVLLTLGTSGDIADRNVDVLYNARNTAHFISSFNGQTHMRNIESDSNFDRSVDITLSEEQLKNGRYFIWSEFLPITSSRLLVGKDIALTGAIRVDKQ